MDIWSEEYSIVSQKSGNLLIEVVTRESHFDTNVTTYKISIQLSTLDDFMAKCGYDISKCNKNFKFLLESIKARGETTNHLLTNLFK